MKQKTRFLSSIIAIMLVSTGCSTIAMEKKVAEENKIDTDIYAYPDDAFLYNEGLVQQIADRLRLEELTTENVASIMEDEIEAGSFNEVLVYYRYLLDQHPNEAALYTEQYGEALMAHIQSTAEPSELLLADATESARKQYELHPENQDSVVQYANLLIHSSDESEKVRGTTILFELEEKLAENDEDLRRKTIRALAEAYLLTDQYEQGLDYYKTLASIDPDDTIVYFHISNVLSLLGRDEEAEQYLDLVYAPTTDFLEQYGTDTFGIYSSFFQESFDEEPES